MILTLLSFFTLTSLLHVYWAFGGHWGFTQVLPQKKSGEYVIVPTTRDCVIVAVLLILCAFVYVVKLGVNLSHANQWLKWIEYFIPISMSLRTIGDFRYVGVFKQIKSTAFAENDTRYFTPLCLIIAIISAMVLLC